MAQGVKNCARKWCLFLDFILLNHLGLCKGVCSDESYLLQGYILGRTVSPDSLGFDVSALQQDLNHQLRSPRSSFSSSSQSSLADRAEANHIADLGREDLTKRRSNFQVKHAEQPLKVHITCLRNQSVRNFKAKFSVTLDLFSFLK